MKEAETISADEMIKRAGKRSFYKKGEFWIDTEYNEEKQSILNMAARLILN